MKPNKVLRSMFFFALFLALTLHKTQLVVYSVLRIELTNRNLLVT